MVRQSNMTALLGETLFIRFMSAIPQSRQASLTALYRDTALLRPPYWGTTVCVAGTRHYSNGTIEDYLLLYWHRTVDYSSGDLERRESRGHHKS